MRLQTVLLASTFAAALALGGCGDDDDPVGGAASPIEPASDMAASADPASVTCAAGADGDVDVAIAGFTFEPGDATVDAGAAVTFTNEDPADHSIWSEERIDGEPAFESVGSDPAFRLPEVLHEGDATTCTFPEPGTYAYLCGVHNSMRGTITVG